MSVCQFTCMCVHTCVECRRCQLSPLVAFHLIFEMVVLNVERTDDQDWLASKPPGTSSLCLLSVLELHIIAPSF